MAASIPVNTLVNFIEAGTLERVLATTDAGELVMFDVVASNALPEFVDELAVVEALQSGDATIAGSDPYLPDSSRVIDNPQERAKRDAKWNWIEPLVAAGVQLYARRTRGPLITKRIQEIQATSGRELSYGQILGFLRSYWRRGLTPNALLRKRPPARKEDDDLPDGGRKRGRKSIATAETGIETGIRVGRAEKKLFKKYVRDHYLRQSGMSLAGVWRLMVEEQYGVEFARTESGLVPVVKTGTRFPPLDTFRYWCKKSFEIEQIIERRKGKSFFQNNARPLVHRTQETAFAPGMVMQVDSTLADLELVSRFERMPMGRPHVITAVDAFSRAVVYPLATLENPSWETAQDLLLAILEEPPPYLLEHGLDPQLHLSGVLPQSIRADNGEFGTYPSDVLHKLGIAESNNPPYACAFNALVESAHRRHTGPSVQWKAGAVKKPGDRADKRPAGYETAGFTLDDYQEALWRDAYYYNTQHVMKDYPLTREMRRDGVRPIPFEILRWGMQHLTPFLKSFNLTYARMMLLREEDASATRQGILYKGQRYIPEQPCVEISQAAARRRRVPVRVAVSYRDMTQLLVISGSEKSYIRCELEELSAYKHMSIGEFDVLSTKTQVLAQLGSPDSVGAAANKTAQDVDQNESVQTATKEAQGSQPKSSKHAGTRERRSSEKDERRREQKGRGKASPEPRPHEGPSFQDSIIRGTARKESGGKHGD